MSEPTENEKQLERMKKTMMDSAVNSLSNDIRASAHIGLGIYLAGVEIASAIRDYLNAVEAATDSFVSSAIESQPVEPMPHRGRPKKREEE